MSLDRSDADDSDADDSDADSSSSACALLGHILGAVPDAGRASAHAIRVALNRRSPPRPLPTPSLPPSLPSPGYLYTKRVQVSSMGARVPGVRLLGIWLSLFQVSECQVSGMLSI